VTLTLRDGFPSGTMVTLTQVGWRKGEGWNEGWVYFDDAWEKVLENLRDACSNT